MSSEQPVWLSNQQSTNELHVNATISVALTGEAPPWRGEGGAAVWLNYGVCMEIFQTSILPAPEAQSAPTKKQKRFFFAVADSCSLAQAFSWDAFKNNRWPWERDGWCDESDAKGHFSTVMFSQPSSPGLDSRKGGFSKKKKEAAKTKTAALANVATCLHLPPSQCVYKAQREQHESPKRSSITASSFPFCHDVDPKTSQKMVETISATISDILHIHFFLVYLENIDYSSCENCGTIK